LERGITTRIDMPARRVVSAASSATTKLWNRSKSSRSSTSLSRASTSGSMS
jgi:hypothetical protein